MDAGLTTIPTLDIDNINVAPTSATRWRPTRTWGRDKHRAHGHLQGHAPGRTAHVEAASALFDTLFFDAERYDLSAVAGSR